MQLTWSAAAARFFILYEDISQLRGYLVVSLPWGTSVLHFDTMGRANGHHSSGFKLSHEVSTPVTCSK
jgi:hypothetical protein